MLLRNIIAIAFSLYTLSSAFAQDNWKLKKDKNGIEIYTRNAEGSKYKEFLAKITIDQPINRVYHAVIDSDGFKEWYADCTDSKNVNKENDQSFTRYMVFDIPWPFDDRDVVSKVVVNKKENSIRIDLSNAPEDYPEQEDLVRIPYSKGYWLLTHDKNKTNIEYTYLADPGGLPPWIVNLFIVDGPYKSLTKFKEHVKKSKYDKPLNL